MCEGPFAGHEDLWIAAMPPDQGPEGNLELWKEAEEYLDFLCSKVEARGDGGDGALCALVDAYNRCIEERRRAQDLLKLRQRWAERRVGGVAEPEPIIVPKGTKG